MYERSALSMCIAGQAWSPYPNNNGRLVQSNLSRAQGQHQMKKQSQARLSKNLLPSICCSQLGPEYQKPALIPDSPWRKQTSSPHAVTPRTEMLRTGNAECLLGSGKRSPDAGLPILIPGTV